MPFIVRPANVEPLFNPTFYNEVLYFDFSYLVPALSQLSLDITAANGFLCPTTIKESFYSILKTSIAKTLHFLLEK